jgi:hypothetical protein
MPGGESRRAGTVEQTSIERASTRTGRPRIPATRARVSQDRVGDAEDRGDGSDLHGQDQDDRP